MYTHALLCPSLRILPVRCAGAECSGHAADEHHAVLPHGYEGAAQGQAEEYLLGMARLSGPLT